jgi:hypothetical protein
MWHSLLIEANDMEVDGVSEGQCYKEICNGISAVRKSGLLD